MQSRTFSLSTGAVLGPVNTRKAPHQGIYRSRMPARTMRGNEAPGDLVDNLYHLIQRTLLRLLYDRAELVFMMQTGAAIAARRARLRPSPAAPLTGQKRRSGPGVRFGAWRICPSIEVLPTPLDAGDLFLQSLDVRIEESTDAIMPGMLSMIAPCTRPRWEGAQLTGHHPGHELRWPRLPVHCNDRRHIMLGVEWALRGSGTGNPSSLPGSGLEFDFKGDEIGGPQPSPPRLQSLSGRRSRCCPGYLWLKYRRGS